MLKTIQQFFTQSLHADDSETVDQQRLHLAATALLIEIIEIDSCTEDEEQQLIDLLQRLFAIDPEQIRHLIDMAGKQSSEATDLYQFTKLVNDHYSYSEKCRLLHALWLAALTDNHLNKYEEHTIRKVADLIHVDHSDFIRAKAEARKYLDNS